jgi:alpha-1,2-mannosyltransferase
MAVSERRPTVRVGSFVLLRRVLGLTPDSVLSSPIVIALCVMSVAVAAVTMVVNVRSGLFGFDFRGTIWSADRAILHGRSPYPAADSHALLRQGNPSVYPPPILIATLPFGLLPAGLAACIWSLVTFCALFWALVLTGLRDARCYVLVLSAPAVCSMVVMGQMDGLLALACVLAWRHRDRAIAAGILVALVVAAKLFLAPMIVWLIATRRYAAALVAAAGAAACCLAAWSVIGFRGLREYPALLSADARAFESRGHSLVAMAMRLGLAPTVGRGIAIVTGLGLLVVALRVARRRDGDRRSFTAAVAAGIVLSPIVWLHYFVLIFVGLALSRPRADLVWALVFLTWLSHSEPQPSAWRMAASITSIGLILAASLATSPIARAATIPRQGLDPTRRLRNV